MRADRLLSILLLLQARGRLTARELAQEMEVSVRTIYRDMDALCTAGVPVYAERGPGGGCALMDSYRTTLTGLTEEEVRALFMLGIPAPLTELGVDQEVRSALLKLSASLPAGRRQDQERARQRVHLDPTGWFQVRRPVPLLATIQRALWDDRRLRLTYRLPFETQVQRIVEPYGIVAKSIAWYLVCGQGQHIRVHRVARLVKASLTNEHFTRPADFDLVRFWQAWCAEAEANRPHYPVTLCVAPQLVPYLTHHFGEDISDKVREAGPAGDSGWIELTISFDTLEDARQRILGCGGAIQVLEPAVLRQSIRDFARQIEALYEG